MASEPRYSGLNGVIDASAAISGALAGAGIKIAAVEGHAFTSGDEALAAALWLAYLNEAARMLEQGYAIVDDIDASMRLGCGYPHGPLRQLDEIGLDRAVGLLETLYEASGDIRHQPSKALTDRVAAGQTGVSAGQGFHAYTPEGAAAEAVEAGHLLHPAPVPGQHVIDTVGVVGTGTMASGIVEVFAKEGYEVIFVARGDEKIAGVRAAVEKSLGRAVAKGRLTEDDRDATLARIRGTQSHTDLAEADVVVEAIVEDLETKQALFRLLDDVCKPGAILATTTSSLSVADLASVTRRPEDVIGAHFFNPATLMKLVEIVSAPGTGPEVTASVTDLCLRVGKHPVHCGDRAGFIVNFLLFPYLNDAIRAVEQKLTTVDELDAMIKAWQGLPMGPFTLIDVVGTDVTLAIEQTIVAAFRDQAYEPSHLLEETVNDGNLGRKSGKGFRTYS